MTDEEKLQVAALNAALLDRCACTCGIDGEIVTMCEEHSYLIVKAIAAERDRCCTIVHGVCSSDSEATRIVNAIRGKK